MALLLERGDFGAFRGLSADFEDSLGFFRGFVGAFAGPEKALREARPAGKKRLATVGSGAR